MEPTAPAPPRAPAAGAAAAAADALNYDVDPFGRKLRARTRLPDAIRPEASLNRVFSSRTAAGGGLMGGKTRDIERIVGRARFIAELDRRGFRAVENAGRTTVFCNRDPVRILR